MPRIPVVTYPGGVGSANPAAPNGNRSLPQPSITPRGPAQPREYGVTRPLLRMQRAVRDATRRATGNPFSDGNLIAGVSFTQPGTAVAIEHGLGRAWTGFFVVNRQNVPAPSRGTATLSSGVVTVTATHGVQPDASPLAIELAYNTIAGTPGHLSAPQANRTATTFQIHSDSGSDNSSVDWYIVPPWPADFTATHNPQTDAGQILLVAPYLCTADLWVY